MMSQNKFRQINRTYLMKMMMTRMENFGKIKSKNLMKSKNSDQRFYKLENLL